LVPARAGIHPQPSSGVWLRVLASAGGSACIVIRY
jgi:hypothetical protein